MTNDLTKIVCWWCCVCCSVLLTLCIIISQAHHDHNKIAPCGMIKVFWIKKRRKRLPGCSESNPWQIISRIWDLDLMCMFTYACACKMHHRKWTKHVGVHTLIGLPHQKLAQALTHDDPFVISEVSDCCLDHCPHPWLQTLPNSVSDSKVRCFGLGLAYQSTIVVIHNYSPCGRNYESGLKL